MVSFSDPREGHHVVYTDGYDFQRGYWGNGTGSSDVDWPITTLYSISDKSPLWRGDHIDATPYTREVRIVQQDTPFVDVYDGKDWAGRYHAERHHHMSVMVGGAYNYDIIPGWEFIKGNAWNLVKTQCLNKMAETKVGWGANIGQARSTLSQIAQPFSTLLRAYRYARTGQWSRVASLLGAPRKWINGKYVADLWLQYKYGWEPLMADIYASTEILGSTLGGDSNIISAQKSTSVKETFSSVDGSGYFNQKWECTYKARCGLMATVESEVLSDLNSLGVANPLAIAWELVPFSFVVDWFMPVGNVLEALTSHLGLTYRNGYISTIEEVTKTYTRTDQGYYTNTPDGNGWYANLTQGNPGRCVVATKIFRRQPLYGWPLPSLYGNANPLTTPHVTNALALVRQLL